MNISYHQNINMIIFENNNGELNLEKCIHIPINMESKKFYIPLKILSIILNLKIIGIQ